MKAEKPQPKPIYHITECGCRLLLSGTRYRSGRPNTCREHGGDVIKKERECFDCDIKIPIESGTKGDFRCEHHKKIAKRANNKRSNQKQNAKGKCGNGSEKKEHTRLYKFNIDPRGGYCTGGPACQALKELNCSGCKTFIPIIKGVDPERVGYFAK